jgi:hypothetical protein
MPFNPLKYSEVYRNMTQRKITNAQIGGGSQIGSKPADELTCGMDKAIEKKKGKEHGSSPDSPAGGGSAGAQDAVNKRMFEKLRQLELATYGG